MKMEVETRGRQHKPRNAWAISSWKGPGGVLPRAFEDGGSAVTWIQMLFSRTVRENVSVVSSHFNNTLV